MPTKVLVFESDLAFASELRSELGTLGCTTTVVDDGNVGLQQAASEKPDLILLSIELPRMNGFSVCNKLKKDPNLKDVPLIIMSSESSDETFEQHKKLRTRAEDYVHKPVAFGELLQHIQGFVQLGSAGGADAEGAIVIDDEIEVGASDYLLDDDDNSQTMVVASSTMGDLPARKIEKVDADVDAFAESAFGRMTGPDAAPGEARSMRNGSMVSEPPAAIEAALPAPKRASAAPSPLRSSVPPGRAHSVRAAPMLSGVDSVEFDRAREELARTKERLGASEREIEEARQEIEKLRIEAGEAERLTREIEELKVRLAAGAKTGGISSREFLDLREGLNKKDKEILNLKEQLSRKDKEIVESQDRALALERGSADLDERLLGLEREVTEVRERNEALATDKDLAKKASEDFRARLEKTRAESEGKDRLLSELRTKHAEERAAHEARLASARAELDQVLANERAEQARELDEAEERRRIDLQQARRDREVALAAVHEQADQERRDALSGQAAEIRREYDSASASQRKSHEEALEQARAEAGERSREIEQRLVAEMAEVRKNADEQLAGAVAEVERREKLAVDGLRAELTEKITSIENDRDSRIAALEAKSLREIGDANDKLAKLDMDASALRGELQSLRESKEAADAASATSIANLEKSLAEAQAIQAELSAKAAASTDRVTALDAELTALRGELAQTKDTLDSESSRAKKATSKWEADRQSLERAKDALAVVLAQIEDTEARTL
jgi:CheY-like chemotaxis protein